MHQKTSKKNVEEFLKRIFYNFRCCCRKRRYTRSSCDSPSGLLYTLLFYTKKNFSPLQKFLCMIIFFPSIPSIVPPVLFLQHPIHRIANSVRPQNYPHPKKDIYPTTSTTKKATTWKFSQLLNINITQNCKQNKLAWKCNQYCSFSFNLLIIEQFSTLLWLCFFFYF